MGFQPSSPRCQPGHFKFKSVIGLLIAPHFQRILSAPPPNYKRHTLTSAYPIPPVSRAQNKQPLFRFFRLRSFTAVRIVRMAHFASLLTNQKPLTTRWSFAASSLGVSIARSSPISASE